MARKEGKTVPIELERKDEKGSLRRPSIGTLFRTGNREIAVGVREGGGEKRTSEGKLSSPSPETETSSRTPFSICRTWVTTSEAREQKGHERPRPWESKRRSKGSYERKFDGVRRDHLLSWGTDRLDIKSPVFLNGEKEGRAPQKKRT